jgi:ATP-dependent RNA helicase DHX29
MRFIVRRHPAFLAVPSLIRIYAVRDKTHKNKNRVEWDGDTVYGNDDDETLVDGGQETASQPMRLEKRYSHQTINTINLLDQRAIPYELILRLLERLCFEDKECHYFSAAILIFVPGLGEIRRMNDFIAEHPAFGDEHSFKVYPLHSTLSNENQSAVFDIPPPGVRKIVIGLYIHLVCVRFSNSSILHPRSDQYR